MDNIDTGTKSGSTQRNTSSSQSSSRKVYCGNLPEGTSNEGVREVMGKFGEIERCDVINRNPRKPFAFVTYRTDESAQAAIEELGINFNGRILIVNRSFPSQGSEDGTQEFQRTLYIGNIPLGMKPDVLKGHLMEAIDPIKADYRTHHVPVKGKIVKAESIEDKLQMFAFLIFRSMPDAEKAGDILYDLELEGRRLVVEFSKGRKMQKYRENTVRTVHIGNISWTASEEDIRRKFRLFGELTSVRLITNKETGKSKGYAFLDYASAADADHAVTVLAGTRWLDRNWKVQLEQNEKTRSEMNRGERFPRRERRRSFSPPRRPVFDRVVEKRKLWTTNLQSYGVDRIPERQLSPVKSIGNGLMGGEVTLFVSNLPVGARDHRVRYLLEQLTGPMVEMKKEGPDGWLTYEDEQCAMAAYDILRDHRIEGIRLVVEIVGRAGGSSSRNLPIDDLVHDQGIRDRRPSRAVYDRQPQPDFDRLARKDFDRKDKKRRRDSESNGGSHSKKLFVGNLGYDVTKLDLHNLFSAYGLVTEINLPTKNGSISGYGFIHFENSEDAMYAQRMLNGRQIGSRSLRVEVSTSTSKSESQGGSNKRSRTDSRYDAAPSQDVSNSGYGSSFYNPYPNERQSFDSSPRDRPREHMVERIGVSSESSPSRRPGFELV